MVQIDSVLVSLDVIEKKFCCNLSECKGLCCIEGDAGAPLDDHEAESLQEIYPLIREYLTGESYDIIQKQGPWYTDSDGDKVTSLIRNKECVFVYFDRGIAKCAIEKAFEQGLISFRKPLSCHLYPIRITQYEKFDAVNLHSWACCKPAELEKNHKGIFVYQFLKEPLMRKYGGKWYDELCLVADEYFEARRTKHEGRSTKDEG